MKAKEGGQEWIDTHVHTLFSVGAPWLGATKSLRGVVSGDKMGLDAFLSDVVRRVYTVQGEEYQLNFYIFRALRREYTVFMERIAPYDRFAPRDTEQPSAELTV